MENAFFWISRDPCNHDNCNFSKKENKQKNWFVWVLPATLQQVKGRGSGFWFLG